MPQRKVDIFILRTSDTKSGVCYFESNRGQIIDMQDCHYPTIAFFFSPPNTPGSVFGVSGLGQHMRQGRSLSHTRWVPVACITPKRWLLFLCQCKLWAGVLIPGDQSHSIHSPLLSFLSLSFFPWVPAGLLQSSTKPPLIKYLCVSEVSPCIILFKPHPSETD